MTDVFEFLRKGDNIEEDGRFYEIVAAIGLKHLVTEIGAVGPGATTSKIDIKNMQPYSGWRYQVFPATTDVAANFEYWLYYPAAVALFGTGKAPEPSITKDDIPYPISPDIEKALNWNYVLWIKELEYPAVIAHNKTGGALTPGLYFIGRKYKVVPIGKPAAYTKIPFPEVEK